MKKIVLGMLILICTLFCFGFCVSAEVTSGSCGENDVMYTLDTETGVLRIHGFGSMSEYNEARSQPWHKKREYIKSIIVEDSITSIGKYTLSGLTNATELEIGDGVQRINAWAFFGCTGLTELVIPDSVREIERNAFANCSSLKDITIGKGLDTLTSEIFLGCRSLESIKIPENVISIDTDAFENCTLLENIEIEGELSKLEKDAFLNTAYVNSEDNWSGDYLYLDNYLIAVKEGITGVVEFKEGTTLIASYLFYNNDNIEKVIFPDTVKHIGFYAFYGCDNIKEVEMSNAVKTIESYAFAQCKNLNEITLPDTIRRLGAYAFYGSGVLSNPKYEYEDGIYIGKCLVKNKVSSGTATVREGTIVISGYVFSSNTISNIIIPDSVKTIEDNAFYNCNSLLEVNIPDSVEYVGSSAFMYCTKLVNVVIGDGVQTINTDTFRECKAIENLTLGKSVKYIAMDAFLNAGVKNVYIDNIDMWLNMDRYQKYTSNPLCNAELYIAGERATEITIPYGTEKIDNMTFYACKSIEKVVLPSTVKQIGHQAFRACDSLVEINVDDVEIIGESAFYKCSKLEGTFPGNKTKFAGKGAFDSCSSITTIKIPATLTVIENRAFLGCTKATEIELHDNVTYIGDNAFSSATKVKNLIIPKSVKYIGNGAFNGFSLKYCIYDGNEEEWGDVEKVGNISGITSVLFFANGVFGDNIYWNFDVDTSTLTLSGNGDMKEDVSEYYYPWYKGRTAIKALVVEDGVTSIEEKSFYSCSLIENITIADSVEKISLQAFMQTKYYMNEENWENGSLYIGNHLIMCENSSLKQYIIKPGTITLAEYCLCRSTKIGKLLIPDSVKTIGEVAFSSNETFTSVVLGNQVKRIMSGAFQNCQKLTEIFIPKTLENIEEYAFDGCSKLKDIYYEGSEEDWVKITKGNYNTPLSRATIHYNYKNTKLEYIVSDGVITVKPNGADEGSLVMMLNKTGEKQNRHIKEYKEGDYVYFDVQEADETKLTVWENLSSIKPVSEMTIVE